MSHMRLTGILVTATAAALTLAGCSAAQPTAPAATMVSSTSATTTSAPATTTASPTTPAVWTKAEAGRQYLAMVAPSNKARDGLTAAIKSDRWKRVRAACKTTLAADDKFMRALDAGRWPADVRPLVDDLIASVAYDRNVLIGCRDATSRSELLLAMNAPDNDPHSGAAQSLRVRLGLAGTT